jgi:hypothetical protein
VDERFARVEAAYSLERMRTSRLIVVGAGGSRQFVEDMARAGLGQAVLIDGDAVSLTNIATQQVFEHEVGKPKTHSLRNALKAINPAMQIACVNAFLDPNLDDARMQTILLGSLQDGSGNLLCDRPEVSLLCGFTDSFDAQARVNRLALQFGVPSLSAQVYKEGRGLEITFTHPDYTEACHRCVLSRRYSAFANGYRPDVGSHGTPIFATARLNAIKGMIALALLHAGTGHRRWTALLEGMRNRNLIQVRFDPNIETELGLKVFNRAFGGADQHRLLFDETVWLPQKAEHPRNGQAVCPDCLGSGNLRQRVGTIADTTIFLDGPPTADVPERKEYRGIWHTFRRSILGTT